MTIYIYLLILVYAVLLSFAHLFLKIGTSQKILSSKGLLIFLYCFLAICASLAYLITLSHINLSIAFPATRGTSYILVVIISYLFLKEKLTLKSSIGVLALIIGLFLIS